jgi:hypothetical protein
MVERFSTGNDKLDKVLGGGLLRGTKTIIYGPAGVGKSILGVSIAYKGIKEDKYPGLIINNGSSIDDQMQIDYAKSFFNWDLKSLLNRSNSLDKSFLINYPVSEIMNTWRDRDQFNTPTGPSYFEDPFIIFHLPKTKRVILDDLLQNNTESLSKFFGRYNSSNQTKLPTDWYSSDNKKLFEILTNEEQLRLYSQNKLKNVKLGFQSSYISERDNKFKELEKIGLRKMDKHKSGYQDICYFQTWQRKLMKPTGPIEPNIRLENNIPKDHSFVINMSLDKKNIFEIVNGPVINRELDAGVNTIIALGYMPSSKENMYQKPALAILKHRGSFYDKKIFTYEITDKGFNIEN